MAKKLVIESVSALLEAVKLLEDDTRMYEVKSEVAAKARQPEQAVKWANCAARSRAYANELRAEARAKQKKSKKGT